jgi:hypothetical protein
MASPDASTRIVRLLCTQNEIKFQESETIVAESKPVIIDLI